MEFQGSSRTNNHVNDLDCNDSLHTMINQFKDKMDSGKKELDELETLVTKILGSLKEGQHTHASKD